MAEETTVLTTAENVSEVAPPDLRIVLDTPEMERRQSCMENFLGIDWIRSQQNQSLLGKKRHPLAAGWVIASGFILRRKAANAPVHDKALEDGSLNDYFNLARELEEVQSCQGWDDSGIINRLKNANEYRGARFEVRVASGWIRSKASVSFVPRSASRTADLLVRTKNGDEFYVECKCKQDFPLGYISPDNYLRVRQEITGYISQHILEKFPDREFRFAFVHFGNLRREFAVQIANQVELNIRQNNADVSVLWNLECAVQIHDITSIPAGPVIDANNTDKPTLFPSVMPRLWSGLMGQTLGGEPINIPPSGRNSVHILEGGFLATELNPIANSMRRAKKQAKGMLASTDKPTVVCIQVDSTLVPSEGITDYLLLIRLSLLTYFERYQKNWGHINGVHVTTETKTLVHYFNGHPTFTPYGGEVFVRNKYADIPMDFPTGLPEAESEIIDPLNYLNYTRQRWIDAENAGQSGNDSNVHHPDAGASLPPQGQP